jgi:hypothetical protein
MEKEAMDRDEKEATLRLKNRTMIFRRGWSAFMGAVRTILQEAPSALSKRGASVSSAALCRTAAS